MATYLVLDAIEQAMWIRQQEGVMDLKDVLHHTDRGSQYASIRFSERLSEANALAETVNGLYKTELIRPRKPWRTIEEVELGTAEPKEGIMINLAEYDALSFDCYGTLIDWEAGIARVLAPWAKEVGLDLTDEDLLLAYAENEAQAERDTPEALYSAILAEAFRRTGDKLGKTVSPEWAEKLGGSVPDWPAFPDSHDALASLAKDYKLIILSNVHHEGFAGSNARLGVQFDKIITAQDVKAYKPAPNHFEALDVALNELAVPRERLLHVAQSLFHDHVPAKRHGLPSVWINRRHDRPGWGATPEPSGEYSYDLEYSTMEAFAAAARKAKAE